MAAKALREIIFEKAVGAVCCGYKKGIGRNVTYDRQK